MNRRGVNNLELLAGLAVIGGMAAVALMAGAAGRKAEVGRQKAEVGKGNGVVVTRSAISNEQSEIAYIGLAAGGCATANCHGGRKTESAPWKTSAFIVQQQDPHAQAFDVLFEERSREMIDRLTRQQQPPGAMQDSAWYLGQLENHCVACHATPLPKDIDESQARTSLAFQHYSQGVSCEACHGPASQWVHEHLSDTWQTGTDSAATSRSSIDKSRFGFRDLADLPTAAKACARCHIGSPGDESDPFREVSHDLIAAGHPRLDFDFASWYAAMPKHWDAAREERAGFHAEAWLHGQLETLHARTRLAEAQWKRAQSASDAVGPVWPELSSLDCFACHHALRLPQNYSVGAGNTVVNTQLTFGSSWKLLERLVPEVSQANDRLGKVLAMPTSAVTADGSAGVDLSWPDGFNNALLAMTLANYARDEASMKSWDELASWYYAARAVVRDAQLETQSAPYSAEDVQMAEESLATLRIAMERFITPGESVSRYASPRVFPQGDKMTPEGDDPIAAFRQAQQALEALNQP